MSNLIGISRDKLEAMAFGRMEFAEFSQYMDELQRMLARPESASGKLPPIGRQAVWQAIDEALTGTVEPMLRGDICNILAAILVPATQHQGEPVVWWNGCNESVPAALRYLANHPRPSGGEQRYNAEHLYQLAGEIERMAKTPLYARPAEQPAPISSTSDKYKAELYDEVWMLARDMGFGNVTDALMKLKKQPAPVAVVLPSTDDLRSIIRKAARDADLMPGANYYTAAELAAEDVISEVARLNPPQQ